MKNQDLIKQEWREQIRKALNSDNPDAFADALFAMNQAVTADFKDAMREYAQTKDESILAARGVRALTKGETELEGAIDYIDVVQNKLTAFLPVSKDMLNVGPTWIDAYVRAVLVEALGAALCKAIIAGTGKDEPIGMLKDVSKSANVQDGVSPDK